MSYPSNLPSYQGFIGTDTLATDNHAAQHNQEQADIAAIATKTGTGASSPTNATFLRGNGSGTSAWAQANLTTDVTGILPIANGGTGATAATGTGNVVLANTPSLTNPAFSSITNTGTLTLPSSTDTLVGRATTDTLTNKTYDTASAGNSLKINGTSITAVTGTGTAVLATSPTISGLKQSGINYQANVTNSTLTNTFEQWGWAFITTPGSTGTATVTITLPVAFTTFYGMTLTPLGYKTGSDPASISDFNSGSGFDGAALSTVSASAPVVTVFNTAGGNWGTGERHGFMWRAIGA